MNQLTTLMNYIKWFNDEAHGLLDAASSGDHTKDVLKAYISAAKQQTTQLKDLLDMEVFKMVEEYEKK